MKKIYLFGGLALTIIVAVVFILYMRIEQKKEVEKLNGNVHELEYQLDQMEKQANADDENVPADVSIGMENKSAPFLMTAQFPESFFPAVPEVTSSSIDIKNFVANYYGVKPQADDQASSYLFDLNGDGIKENLVFPKQLEGNSTRGTTGNGDILVISSTEEGLEFNGILSGNSFSISKTKTNGYFDILTKSYGSAEGGSEKLYKLQTTPNLDREYKEVFSQDYQLAQ